MEVPLARFKLGIISMSEGICMNLTPLEIIQVELNLTNPVSVVVIHNKLVVIH